MVKRLANIRKALEDIEKLRYKAKKEGREQDIELLEESSVELKKEEREIIKKIGEDIASAVKASGESLEELTIKLKERVARMGRLPKRLDSLSKIILKISNIIDL